jgi:glycosyltransferase involved in cell wall biosynthesis
MRIALLGTRGVPANYGGSETAAEEIYSRLAARGHDVVVYCRKHKVDPAQKWYRGIRTVVLPSIDTKALDTISHSLLSILDVVAHNRADIVHFHGIGNAILFPILECFGKRVVVGVDGMDWKRNKWNWLERRYLRLSLNMAVGWSDAVYVDSLSAQRFCKEFYGREFPLISYGAQVRSVSTTTALVNYGLEREKYVLFVGRLIPEKGVHHLIRAFENIETEYRLVIVGDNPYNPKYVASLKSTRDPRISFVGYVYGDGFWELCSNCYLYVQPSEVEGTSPVLLSAMGCGRCVVVNGIQENLDVIGDAGIAFLPNDAQDLARILEELFHQPERVHALGESARQRVSELFSWDNVALLTEQLYSALAHKVG